MKKGADRGAPAEYEQVAVDSIQSVASDAFILRIPKRQAFTAGQMIGLTTGPGIAPRLYSIASGPADPLIEVLFTTVKGGELTPGLSRLRPGDPLWVSLPKGEFTDDSGPSWWIASGTGVAPFASMVRSGLSDNKRLVHGSRSLGGFYYAELFGKALGARYIRCSSGEQGPGVYPGRLTAWLSGQDAPREGTRFFLCGSNAMVVEVRDILIAKGVPFDRIISEIYF